MTARAYVGWQRQDGPPSVQGAIEEAIAAFCGERVTLRGAGRTDAGVHATARSRMSISRKRWTGDKVRDALNAHLQTGRRDASPSSPRPRCRDDFDARFSATGRHYLYRILNRRAPAALERKRGLVGAEAARRRGHARGRADACSAGTTSPPSAPSQCQANSPVRTLDRLDVTRNGDIDRDPRRGALVPAQPGALDGRLAEAGRRGRLDARPMSRAALEARDRAACGPVAPPDGLYLVGVDYPTALEHARAAD